MAGTDNGGYLEHPLDTADLDGLLALSASANWNQSADDWRYLLAAGQGHGLSTSDGRVVASCVVLPYPGIGPAGGFAWISMVLVHPDHQGAGLATRVLRRALDAGPQRAVLDATPQGLPVYRRLGFDGAWTFARHEGRGGVRRPALPTGLRIVALSDAHPSAVAELDRAAFGADRSRLLAHLASRAPDLALVALRDDRPVGYVLGRPGRQATQVGPLVAMDAATGIALLDSALSRLAGPVFVDVPDREHELPAALHDRGFAVQRPFTRLVRGASGAGPADVPGTGLAVRLVAGPELG